MEKNIPFISMKEKNCFVGFPTFIPGSVWLVGAGPGDPGLLSLLGYYALTEADDIVYDALVSQEILNWART